MKYTIIMFLACIFSLNLYGQNTKVESKSFQINIGYIHLSNYLNGDKYSRFKSSVAANNGETSMSGVSLRLTIPSEIKYIDFILGSMFLVGDDRLGSTSWTPGNTNSDDYTLNGGGVYFGISPKLKGKYIGLTSDFAIGAFSFKEYLSIFNNIYEPFVDEHNLKASYGLGAMSSIGMFINVGKVGVNPSIIGIFSGGSGTSFTFYGFDFSVTYQF
ncbi:MAG: hypothetical protein GY834_12970 [Bacteroidetes bacterium]|nr:hypothetical protein [Bacteroidota bacterium]